MKVEVFHSNKATKVATQLQNIFFACTYTKVEEGDVQTGMQTRRQTYITPV